MLALVRRLLQRGPKGSEALPEVTIRPIGVVRNRIKQPGRYDWGQVTSEIVLRPDLAEGLLGLLDYSHIIVLSWLHAIPEEVRGSKLRLHPRDNPEFPLQGILATRSQIRPNPIALTAVPLMSIKGNVLRVRGLDNVDGTPVLDIKPYIPAYDSVSEARIPDWAQALDRPCGP